MVHSVSSDSQPNQIYLIFSIPPQIPKTISAEKQVILDEYINFGYFYIPFMCYRQLMTLVLIASFLFTTFGSRLPAILKCGDESFEKLNQTEQCIHLEELRASGNNCTPELDNDFWSLPQELNYYCDTAYLVKWATITQTTGQLVGAFTAGQLSDMFGRKKISIAGIVGLLGSFVGVSFTSDLVWYSVAMFFMAVFSSCLITVDTAYYVEMVPQKHVMWGSMFIGASPNVIIFAGLAWISHDFRTLARVCAGITAALLVMQIWCPESPRWLLQRRKLEEAKNVVKRIHKWNRTLTEEKSNELDAAFYKESSDIREKPLSRKVFYFTQVFFTEHMTARCLALGWMYTTFHLAYYGLFLHMELLPGNIFLLTACIGAAQWIINIVHGIVDIKCSNLSRIRTLRVLIVAAFLDSMAILFLELNEFHVASTTAIIIFVVLSSHISSIIRIVTGEVFPTLIRNSAIGLVHFCGWFWLNLIIILMLFDPDLNYITVCTFYPVVMSILYVHGFVPEPKGVPFYDKMPDENEWRRWETRN